MKRCLIRVTWSDQNFRTIGSSVQFNSVQSLSRVWLFATPWITACQASLSITNCQSLLKLMSIESVMPSSHLIFYRPLLRLPPIPPAPNLSQHQGLFQWVNSSHEVAKYWSFSFIINPSNDRFLIGQKRRAWRWVEQLKTVLTVRARMIRTWLGQRSDRGKEG